MTITQLTTYVTTDGKSFTIQAEAVKHQNTLNRVDTYLPAVRNMFNQVSGGKPQMTSNQMAVAMVTYPELFAAQINAILTGTPASAPSTTFAKSKTKVAKAKATAKKAKRTRVGPYRLSGTALARVLNRIAIKDTGFSEQAMNAAISTGHIVRVPGRTYHVNNMTFDLALTQDGKDLVAKAANWSFGGRKAA